MDDDDEVSRLVTAPVMYLMLLMLYSFETQSRIHHLRKNARFYWNEKRYRVFIAFGLSFAVGFFSQVYKRLSITNCRYL